MSGIGRGALLVDAAAESPMKAKGMQNLYFQGYNGGTSVAYNLDAIGLRKRGSHRDPERSSVM